MLADLSCPTLCDSMDCSPLDSSVYGILQARILEWVDIPSPADLPDPGIKLRYPAWQADSPWSEPPWKSSTIVLLLLPDILLGTLKEK